MTQLSEKPKQINIWISHLCNIRDTSLT